ncbi:phage tail protein [Abyssisolibacter fermentans]|uniref:phage tail protein n=1 Tax=Abyssisolibacter fermentans TaxID=1766203 RepID=UPI00082B0181|nr:tail fiber protein [Abyssisolibacter fermentans]
MSEPFIGEIKGVGFDFAPVNWAKCEGQLLDIYQNDALFSLLGKVYGGDGVNTFGLPDLRKRCLVGSGNGKGLIPRAHGEKAGSEYITLNAQNLPAHKHTFDSKKVSLNASTGKANLTDPTDAIFAYSQTKSRPAIEVRSYSKNTNRVDMSNDGGVLVGTTGNTGGNRPFSNMIPYLTINYIIALDGIYPQRS